MEWENDVVCGVEDRLCDVMDGEMVLVSYWFGCCAEPVDTQCEVSLEG